MPRLRKTPPPGPTHRWYLAEWGALLKKRQADAIRDLGWSRSSVSDIWTGKQPYNQLHVDQVSRWLEIEPYELLMLPIEAMRIRRLKEMFREFAAEEGAPFEHERGKAGGQAR